MERTLFGYWQSAHCENCGRALTDPVSVARGIGPICWGKGLGNNDMNRQDDFETRFIDKDVETYGVILERDENGTATNIPSLVTHHSPTGFEWGYGGSGPADLALNICELALRKMAHDGPTIECWDGRECFAAAWQMHQDFKYEFIAGIDRTGGSFSWRQVTAWVGYHIPEEMF